MKYIMSSFILVSLLVLTGCTSKSDGNVFVTGTVTQGGQPIEDATVRFATIDGSGEGASGKTDASGKFVLTTSTGKEGSGTKPGEYKVAISKTKIEWDGKTMLPPMREGEEPSKDEKVVQLLPLDYGNFSKTPFKATVTANKNDNVFEFSIP